MTKNLEKGTQNTDYLITLTHFTYQIKIYLELHQHFICVGFSKLEQNLS